MLLTLEGPALQLDHPDFYTCPTYSLTAANIDYQKYWRGPIWINMNWLLYHGLLRYDMEEAAQIIKQNSLALIKEFGFHEYFDPRKKEVENLACGTDQFSWTAALCIDLLAEDEF